MSKMLSERELTNWRETAEHLDADDFVRRAYGHVAAQAEELTMAQAEAAAMRSELEAALRRCPNCKGEGRQCVGIRVDDPGQIVRWQDCLTCKSIRVALSGTAGKAMLDEVARLQAAFDQIGASFRLTREVSDGTQ